MSGDERETSQANQPTLSKKNKNKIYQARELNERWGISKREREEVFKKRARQAGRLRPPERPSGKYRGDLHVRQTTVMYTLFRDCATTAVAYVSPGNEPRGAPGVLG